MGGRSDSRSRGRGRARSRSRSNKEEPTGKSVLVKNLNYATTVETLREEFQKFGEIKDVYVPVDFNTRQAKGFGFIEYAKREDASEAVREMDEVKVGGNNIRVCVAQNRRKSPASMRRRENMFRRKSTSRSRSRSRSRRRSPSRRRSRSRRSDSRRRRR